MEGNLDRVGEVEARGPTRVVAVPELEVVSRARQDAPGSVSGLQGEVVGGNGSAAP